MTSTTTTTKQLPAEPTLTNSQLIIENGDAPTAVILAVTIFTSVLLGSLTKLVREVAQVSKR